MLEDALSGGIRVDALRGNTTALMMAASRGKGAAITYLLSMGANVEGHASDTPLHVVRWLPFYLQYECEQLLAHV